MKNEPNNIVFALAGMCPLTGLCTMPTLLTFAALTLLGAPSPAAAQDVDGNNWYVGEVAENYELFDGDDPEQPELVELDPDTGDRLELIDFTLGG